MRRFLGIAVVVVTPGSPAVVNAHPHGFHGGGFGGGFGHGSGFHGSSHSHVFFRGGVFFDPFFFPYSYPYPYYDPYYPYYAPYYAPYPPPDAYPPPDDEGQPPPDAGGGSLAENAPPPEDSERASYGLVQLRGVPDGAAVDLDGRFWLTANGLDQRWLAIPDGEHTVAVRVRGARAVERSVDVKAGKPNVVRFGPFPRAAG